MSNKLSKKVLSANTTLKDRRTINDVLDALNKKRDITYLELESIAEALLDMGDKIIPLIAREITNNFINSKNEKILKRYLYLIGYLNFDEFINPLIDEILKRDLDEQFKANVINTLNRSDIYISSPIFSIIFGNMQSRYYLFDEEFFEEAQLDEDLLIDALDWFYDQPYHKQMLITKRINDIKNVWKVKALEIIAQSSDIDVSLFAIDCLGKTRQTASAEALKRLVVTFEAGGQRKARAIRALRKLELLGVFCDVITIASAEKKNFTCYASMIDSNGNYVLWIVAPESLKPPLEVLCVLVNETEGIIDCFGNTQMTKKEFNSFIKKAKSEDYFVTIDFELCKKMIRNAILITGKSMNDLPVEFLFRKKIFDEELIAEEYTHNFEGFDLDEIKNDTRLLAKTALVNDIHGISSWNIFIGEMFPFAERFSKLQKKASPDELEAKTSKIVDEIFFNLIMPEIDIIKNRLFYTADVLQYDKKNKKQVKAILCAALNLTEISELPFKNPFLLEYILKNLKDAVNGEVIKG